MFELSSNSCRESEYRKNNTVECWQEFFALISQYSGKVTRIDLVIDFINPTLSDGSVIDLLRY